MVLINSLKVKIHFRFVIKLLFIYLYPFVNVLLFTVMKRVLRFGSSTQYSFKRYESIIDRLYTGEKNVPQWPAKPKPRNFRQLSRPVMLAGILGMLGFNREESEEDPITATVKSAILSIQVDRED